MRPKTRLFWLPCTHLDTAQTCPTESIAKFWKIIKLFKMAANGQTEGLSQLRVGCTGPWREKCCCLMMCLHLMEPNESASVTIVLIIGP